MTLYLQLFLTFLKIGAISFGGGYGALSIIHSEVVLSHQWISSQEFMEILTIAEITPGPIAINSATYVGMKIGGIWGAVVATTGSVIVPFLIVILLSVLYEGQRENLLLNNIVKGLKTVVLALIISVFITMGQAVISPYWLEQKNLAFLVIKLAFFIGSYYLMRKKGFAPIRAMFLCGVLFGSIKTIVAI
ncbi:MAG: chromate transporter [Tissierellia bacterium]|nr:chromate transporter [Tissierellia bacterium]